MSRFFGRHRRLEFVALSETAQLPVYATAGAAGLDLFADEDGIVPVLGRLMIKTNIGINLPRHLEAQIRARSGLAYKQGITVLNGPATIDPDYAGGIGVILFNAGDQVFRVAKGDRIAQLVISEFERVTPVMRAAGTFVAKEPRQGVRGTGGFGSTGTGALAAAGLAVATVTPTVDQVIVIPQAQPSRFAQKVAQNDHDRPFVWRHDGSKEFLDGGTTASEMKEFEDRAHAIIVKELACFSASPQPALG